MKGEEPEPLRAWKAGQQAACIEPRYGDLSRDAQQVMKQSLFIEQAGQCVYCGRAIELEDRNKHHVEHFRPRTRYPQHELAYENLFLSCGPQQLRGSPQPTCGNEKAAWFDGDCHVEPAPEDACQRHFAFASDGRIRGGSSPEANRMIDVLKLNRRELIAERSALIEHLDGELKEGTPLSALINSFLDISPSGTRVSFANVAVTYLLNQRESMQQA
ncbi:MAG: TIGR02646 family protein [Chloroflexi bacterium]|nr:TIGR02646 family protein [Chloroflexota bacterium]